MPQVKKSKNTRVTISIVTVFILAFLAVGGIMLIYQMLGRPDSVQQTQAALHTGAWVCGIVSLCMIAASFVLTVRKHTRAGLVRSVAAVVALLFVVCWSLNVFYVNAVHVLNVVLPGLAVLYFVYHIFQREFSTQTVILAGYAAGLWTVVQYFERDNLLAGRLCGLAMALVLLVAALALPRLRENKGKLILRKHEVALCGAKTNYTVLRITLGVLAVCLVTVAVFTFFGSYLAGRAAYYAMLAVFGYLFVLAVFYTTMLIGE